MVTPSTSAASTLVSDVLRKFENVQRVKPGTVLFREGEEARGIYYVRSGAVELVYASRTGDAKPLRAIEPGTILGLSCVVSNKRHDCSATAKSAAEIGFVERDELQKLLSEKPDTWLAVLQLISSEVSSCWECMRSLTKC
jgi:CRP-like cAMP-binding protein